MIFRYLRAKKRFELEIPNKMHQMLPKRNWLRHGFHRGSSGCRVLWRRRWSSAKTVGETRSPSLGPIQRYLTFAQLRFQMPPPEKRRYRRNLPRQCSSLPSESMAIEFKSSFIIKILVPNIRQRRLRWIRFNLGWIQQKTTGNLSTLPNKCFCSCFQSSRRPGTNRWDKQPFSRFLARHRILLLGRNWCPGRPLHSRTSTFRSPNGRRRNQTQEHVNLGETLGPSHCPFWK